MEITNLSTKNNANFKAIKLIKGDSKTIRKIHNKFLQATMEGMTPEIVRSNDFKPKFEYTSVQLNPYQDLGEDIFVIATGKDVDNVHSNMLKAFNSKLSGTPFVRFMIEKLGLSEPQDAQKMLQELDNSYNYAELAAK